MNTSTAALAALAAACLLAISGLPGPAQARVYGPGSDASLESPGLHRVKVAARFQGARRTYDVRLPAGFDGSPAPLIVVLHGAFSTGRETDRISGFDALADAVGAVVMYPNGIGVGGMLQHWNAGHCCGLAETRQLDDAAFVLDTIDDARARVAVDPQRVYLVGYSNGGMLAHLLAASHPERFAAVAVVAGTVGTVPDEGGAAETIPPPTAPIPMLVVHGDADTSIAFEGGDGGDGRGSVVVAAAESARLWVEGNGCAGEPATVVERDGALELRRWERCDSGVIVGFWTLGGWGHEWPSRHFTEELAAGQPLDGFDLAPRAWEFLERAGAGARQDQK